MQLTCSMDLFVAVLCQDGAIVKGYYQGTKQINGFDYVTLSRLDGAEYVPIHEIKSVKPDRPELLLIEGKN